MRLFRSLVATVAIALAAAPAFGATNLAAGNTAATSSDIVVTSTGTISIFGADQVQRVSLELDLYAGGQDVPIGSLAAFAGRPSGVEPFKLVGPGTYHVKRPNIAASGLSIGVQSDVSSGGGSSSAVTQSGPWNIANVTGTVSLPTGAATDTGVKETHQTSGSTKFDRVASYTSYGIPTGNLTFNAYIGGHTYYATPQDLFCLSNPGSKKVVLGSLQLLATSTAATTTPLVVHWVKRTTLNSGGTPVTETLLAQDSSGAAATAVLTYWTALPTLGTSAGDMSISIANTTATTTGVPVSYNAFSAMTVGSTIAHVAGLVLNTNEAICANMAGAALPAGFTAYEEVQEGEFTSP